nr:type VI secretion system membrane subunit TssM [uncultured Cohaesibacter sp.]
MFKTARSYLFNIFTVLIVFSLIMAFAIWYLGPLLAIGSFRPFDLVSSRIIASGSILAGLIIAILVIQLRRRNKDQEMAQAITRNSASPASKEDETVKAELDELKSRMNEALAFLRKSKLGGRFGSVPLYQLPWYVIIGPPGAGKTTAIVKSGLKFPLAESMGKTPIGGVGGTRNCDWWFTNEAVLLDTAGRYTTQDSNQDADARAWTGFLDMLKKYRKRQPINGAIVSISLSDLSMQGEDSRRAHARAIRTRLHELRERLGVRFPIYIMFTKADLIAGFQEFFDNLGSEERAQVWGFTLPYEKGDPTEDLLAGFEKEFDRLLSQLSNRSLERMQAETDYQRRSLISGFPNQIASLRPVAKSFLGDIFQESRYEDNQFLRGVYFTSGTQEGTPIDRLMMGMAREFGIGRQAIGTGRGQGRSYFLTRLLTGVIFKESGLVSNNDKVERRYRWIKGAAITASILALGATGAALGNSFFGNKALISSASAQVDSFSKKSEQIPRSPISDADIAATAPALNILRDLPGNPAASDSEPPIELTFGLFQGDAIGTETAQTYRSALNTMLLPRLLFRLEEQMQANMNNPDLLFEALKVYLMLGLQGPMDAETVEQWMKADWALAFSGDEQLQSDLLGHLDAMIHQPMQQIALDGPLVDQIQALLAETPLAERIYKGIINAPPAKLLAPLRITDVGGPAVSRVMLRPSGRPLSSGVDGIYTRKGFLTYFLPRLATVGERAKFENLVLGSRAEEVTPEALKTLGRDVLALYESDYVTQYDQLLGDIDIIPMESIGQATQVINILSGPASPIRNILKAVSSETKLTTAPQSQIVAGKVGSEASSIVKDKILQSLDSDGQAIFNALGAAANTGADEAGAYQPGQFVEQRFADLHALVDSPEGAPSELDGVISRMGDIFNELNRLSLGQNTGAALVGKSGNAAAELQAATTRLPNPLQRWATQVVAASSGAAVGGARADINAKWQTQVLPFCTRAIEGRYPFNRQAKADVALQDFGRLFAPSGLIDKFFNENLAQFVDTASNPWRLKRVNGVDIGISNAVIAQFQKANEIRDSFFLSSGLPAITFDVTPVALDPNVEQVTVEIDGQPVIYAHGPPEVTPITWPGQNGPRRNRVAFTPSQANIKNDIQRDGPWGWFRLLDTAEIRRTNVTDRNSVIFNIGGRIAIFQIRAGSALNPFTISALKGFSCPSSL